MRKSLEELAQKLNTLRGKYQLRPILHIKSSGLYFVRDFEFKESDMLSGSLILQQRGHL